MTNESLQEAGRAQVLITVKASPEIGRTHGETVCVAGLRLDGGAPRWIRLFPVQWQWFWRSTHPKYQVIELEVARHSSDPRPESHRPRLETATVIRQVERSADRAALLNQLPQPTMCELVADKGWGRTSLALVVPVDVSDFTWDDHTGDAEHERKMMRAAQGSLLAVDAPQLELCPFTFRFRYRCADARCNGHHQSIVDWEISEAWRRWRQSYPDDYLTRIRDKWMGLVDPARKPGFFVGNQKNAPQAYMILGVARDIMPVERSPEDPTPSVAPRRLNGGNDTPPPQSTEGRLFEL